MNTSGSDNNNTETEWTMSFQYLTDSNPNIIRYVRCFAANKIDATIKLMQKIKQSVKVIDIYNS